MATGIRKLLSNFEYKCSCSSNIIAKYLRQSSLNVTIITKFANQN